MIRNYYLDRIIIMKSYNIKITSNEIDILFDNIQFHYSYEQIRSVYYTEQIERYKLYHVVHLYTYDDHYFYFSNELNRFKILNLLLKNIFPQKYHLINHLLKNFKDPEERALYFEYLKNRKE
ncbi:MAG: hypothetical protein JW702_07880 [Clostridiales bacterium]|nr:hypothetical protein [Clostridiales bacterium]